MRNLFVVALALLTLGAAPMAHASPLFELTGGFAGMGGLQARHTGSSAASSYFNPALLTGARTGLTVGMLVLNSDIGIHVDARNPENAVPDGIQNAFHANGTPIDVKPLATDLLQNGHPARMGEPALPARPRQGGGSGKQTLSYGAIGLVVKLFKERLAIGMYGLVPVKNLMTMQSFYVDEREQYMTNSLHPEMYSDRLTALSFAFAAGVRLTDTLSIGAGATLGLYAFAGAPVYVADASKLTDLDLNINARAKVSLTPHLGIAWNPRRWHLTGTVHAPQKMDIESKFKFLLAGNEQGSGISFTYYYQPWQTSAGLGYDVYVHGDQTWTVSGLAHYQRWSTYIDRQSMRPEGAYEWKDTLSGAAGLRMQDGPLSLGVDGQYKPTPVPLQTGRTNYVDNDRIGAALSMEYAFTIAEVDMKIGGQLQLYRLLERHVTKLAPPASPDGVNRTPQLVTDELPDDAVVGRNAAPGRTGLQTNNPGWPGYSSLGWVTSGGLNFSVYL
jgi:long-chain fatty acid transport protein